MSAATDILKQYWGYSSFRPQQQEVIAQVLQGRDTLALLPTGGGKSLCYQVPALMQEGFCLVVSPLIALMQDQVQRLKSLDIPAAAIHAGMHYNDVKRTLENMLHGPYKLLYVSPERLQTHLFQEYLPAFNISLIAVDEAHCISQWGHDFRPDYLKIAELKELFHDVPMLALTASATEHVQADIIQQLKLNRPALIRQSFERSNIYYDIKYTENKNGELLDFLEGKKGSVLIYCRSRKQTETLARYLGQHGINALHYHAGMAKDKRQEAQERWMGDEVRIMIATTAFGMGIDKPDVRAVIHYDAPEHLEAYYQESGRAGRDGKQSTSLLLYNNIDINRLQESTELQYPPAAYLRQVYQSVVEYLQIPISAEPHRYYDFDLQDFCKKFNLQALPVSYALRLLEQEDLWTISDAVFEPATIQFTTNRTRLDELAQAYPHLAMITTGLLRLYGSIFHYPTAVRLPVIAKQVRMRIDETERLLSQLDAMGIIAYQKPLEGPQLFFHHYRVDSRHLIIDMQRINRLKQQHEERTKAIIHFMQEQNTCRNRMLLSYFNELTDKDCGHCDVCAKKQKPIYYPEQTLRKEIAALLHEHRSMSLPELSNHFSPAIKEAVVALIRRMVDEGKLALHENSIRSI